MAMSCPAKSQSKTAAKAKAVQAASRLRLGLCIAAASKLEALHFLAKTLFF
jgi:hypothetical protein